MEKHPEELTPQELEAEDAQALPGHRDPDRLAGALIAGATPGVIAGTPRLWPTHPTGSATS